MVPEDGEKVSPPSEQGSPPVEPAVLPDSPADAPPDGEATYYDDPYSYEATTAAVYEQPAAPPPAPPPPPSATPEPETDDEGMLRMSFLEHLQELRGRLLKMLAGIGVAFAGSLFFAERLWLVVSAPAIEALVRIGYENPKLAQISPMETFSIVYVKLPLLTSLFIASPWLLYQVWAFIAPGLYKRERRWAAPFVICSAGLFVLGGAFAYFVAFRFGLDFLLRIGRDINIQPYLSITEYFDLFFNVIIGIGIVFELPILIFFLSLLRIVTPGFLIRNSRYAVLAIIVLAAIVTPTPDVINLVLFAVPMVVLYFLGVFASYLLFLHRESRRFPWLKLFAVIGGVLTLAAIAGYFIITRYGYRIVPKWPFLVP